MPYKERKVKGGYQVSGPSGVHAKHTTKAKADAQIRLLRGLEHGMKKRMHKSASGSPLMSQSEIEKGFKSLGGGIHER